MAKYDLLRLYLRRQRTEVLELSFAEIERLIGGMLPNSAAKASWWTTLTESEAPLSLCDCGYHAVLIPRKDRVRFTRRRDLVASP